MNRETTAVKNNRAPVATLYRDGRVCILDETGSTSGECPDIGPSAGQCREQLVSFLKGYSKEVLVEAGSGKLEPMDERHMDRFMHVMKNVHPSANVYEVALRIQADMDIRKREVCI